MLLQEKYRKDPWRVLAVCVLMNQTTGEVARRVARKLFGRWPGARDLAAAHPVDVAVIVHPCGLQMVRARRLIAMSRAYAAGKLIHEMSGVGRYARESWRIFVEGDTNFEPQDVVLRNYVEKVKKSSRKESKRAGLRTQTDSTSHV